MRDVRSIFVGLWILAAASVVVLIAPTRRRDRPATWRAVGRGALGLSVAIAVVGGVALVAFDALFEFFHTILFPAGSYTFDPATERLVQLFPFQFWEESALVVGIVIIAISLVTAIVAGRRSAASSQSFVGVERWPAPEPGR